MQQWMKDQKIGKKLIISFTVVIAGMLLISIVAAISLTLIKSKVEFFYNTPYQNTKAQLIMRRDTQSIMKNLLWVCTTTDLTKREQLLAEIDEDMADQAEQYSEKTDEGMKLEAKEAKEQEELRQEEASFDVAEISEEGKHQVEMADTSSSVPAELSQNVTYDKSGEAVEAVAETKENIDVSV